MVKLSLLEPREDERGRDNTSTGDGTFEETVKFFILMDGKHDVARCDATFAVIASGIARE